MAELGSEEFYRGLKPQDDRNALELLQQQGQTQQGIQQQMGQSNAQGIRDVGANVAGAIGNLPSNYFAGEEAGQRRADSEQRLRHGETGIRAEEAGIGQTKATTAATEAGTKLTAANTREAEQLANKSEEEAGYRKLDVNAAPTTLGQQEYKQKGQAVAAGIAATNATAAEARAQTHAIASGTNSQESKDRIEKTQGAIAQALKTGNPQDLSMAQQNAKRAGVTDVEWQNALTAVQSGGSAKQVANDQLFNTSPVGQAIVKGHNDISQETDEIANLIEQSKNYKAARYGSAEADNAASNAKMSLAKLGDDQATVDPSFTNLQTRSAALDKAIDRHLADIKNKIARLESSAGANASTQARQAIDSLKQKFQAITTQRSSKVDIFSGKNAPTGGTTMTNILSGNMGPSPGNIPPQGPVKPQPLPAGMSFAPGAIPPQQKPVNPAEQYSGYKKR